MSEWGIEQPSTFGNAGGCFVELLSGVGAIVVVAALVCTLPNDKKEKVQDTQSKTETVKTDTTATPRDTIMFTPSAEAAFRDIEKQNEILLQKTARDMQEVERLARMHSHIR